MVTVDGSIVYPLVALLNSSIVTSLESMHVDMLIGRPLIANPNVHTRLPLMVDVPYNLSRLLAFTERGSTFQIKI